MKVLYIGGTGEISFDCIHESVKLGHDVSVYNRGNNNAGLPGGIRFITGDIHDDAAYGKLADENFDVISQFHLFSPDEIKRDIDLFAGHCGQYVFISSASCYQKPVRNLPITENTPLVNPFWAYSRAKAEMENILRDQNKLPYTIVRPSHTYRTHMTAPFGGQVEVSRLLRGKPLIVHGDGESLWTVTHARDFAPPFVKLLGNKQAIGEDFHLTSDHAPTWNEVIEAIAAAIGVSDYQIVHVPSDTLVRYNDEWEGPLLGDKSRSVIFDNTKIKSVVGDFDCPIDPWQGMKLVAEQFPPDANDFDPESDALQDRIIAEQSSLGA